MNVEKLIQVAEWCAKNDDCENCPVTDECPFTGKGALQVIAVRDHGRSEALKDAKHFAVTMATDNGFVPLDEFNNEINTLLDELAWEER